MTPLSAYLSEVPRPTCSSSIRPRPAWPETRLVVYTLTLQHKVLCVNFSLSFMRASPDQHHTGSIGSQRRSGSTAANHATNCGRIANSPLEPGR
jgi:hypothetical protein